jgi:hypothetical protein
MPDAPDYTLLSDVNVVGSVTLDVNVVGSVTLNVNVTNASLDVRVIGSTVTLNVNVVNTRVNVSITGQTINVSVINPTGVPLYIAQPVRVQRTRTFITAAGPQTKLIVSVTGRARLLAVAIFAQASGGWSQMWPNTLRIIVDGVTNDISFRDIAHWNGGRPYYHPPDPGAFFDAGALSRLGGWAYAETTSAGAALLSLVMQQEIDAVSSLEVDLVVPSGVTSLAADIQVLIGFYP